jgi:hypothetical protein
MEDLFAVRLPAGIVRVIEKRDDAKRVLEDLLVRGIGRGHDDSIGRGFLDRLERRRGEATEYIALSVVRSFDSSA